jgi:aromatic ring-opening dioxygenase catalytic subunit (LigB family)
MAELVGVFAASHGPVIVRDWDKLRPEVQAPLTAAFEALGDKLNALNADLIIELSPDHWVNFFMNNLPAVCIGVGAEHDGPPEPFMKTYPYATSMRGDPAFAAHLTETAFQSGFEPSISHHLILDHGFCIPLWRMKLDRLPTILPIIINNLEPPMISLRRCLQWGRLLAEAIASYPADLRVVILATGGLSHSIGESTMGEIDEAFDRRCIAALESGDDQVIVDELEDGLGKTGNGAQEARNWVIAQGAAGGGFELISYVPTPDVYVGCAFAWWDLKSAGGRIKAQKAA